MEAGRMVRKLLHITVTMITTVHTTRTCTLCELHSHSSQGKATQRGEFISMVPYPRLHSVHLSPKQEVFNGEGGGETHV